MTDCNYMAQVYSTQVQPDSLAIWFLGQNGFLLKTPSGKLIAIDPYLTNSCANLSTIFQLRRRLPFFVAPGDFAVDMVLLTHSHADHLDEETLRHLPGSPHFVAPWEAMESLKKIGIADGQRHLLHPHQRLSFDEFSIEGTFALPTDVTDLNHIGVLLELSNGIRFYNTGDCAYAEHLQFLLPSHVDICAICINGLFHNLSHQDAAKLTLAIQPRLVIPTHYDMMLDCQSDPDMFRIALLHANSNAQFHQMGYADPLLYTKGMTTS